eukprot:1893436-Pyramimonas_sp.AAC.1
MATGVNALSSTSCGASHSSVEPPFTAAGSDAATACNAFRRVDWVWKSEGMAPTPATSSFLARAPASNRSSRGGHSRRVLGNTFAPRSA